MASKTYKELLGGINAFLFDVDGVFTDNRTLLIPDMDPVRSFYTRDAFAVQHAVKEGFRIIIITGGRSKGVADSFGRLGVTEFHNSVQNKAELFAKLVVETGLDPTRAAYMGDDLPDLRVMQRVALPCCPSDAAEEVKAIITANHELADVMAISGTPAFVLKNTLLRGYVPLEGMQAIVAEERSAG